MPPSIPCASGPTLYPIILMLEWLRQQEDAAVDGVQLLDVPFGNGSLPDLLRLAGIQSLHLAEACELPAPFRWEGSGGARVVVQRGHDEVETAALPLHHGPLPCSSDRIGGMPRSLNALINLARLEDATAVITKAPGARWEHILAQIGSGAEIRIPPQAGKVAPSDQSAFQVWNPLPFSRPCPVTLSLPTGTPPWSLRDQDGRVLPVQVIEGMMGRELLSQVELGALAACELQRHDEPVDLSHWEVSNSVLDNGLLRAEFDKLGQVKRLCYGTEFLDIVGPCCAPQIDGLPFSGSATVAVLESGPVRGRISVVRENQLGLLHLIYSCYAGEDILHVNATWRGQDGRQTCCLDHPSAFRRAPLRCGSELAPWYVPQAASVIDEPASTQLGCRWAELGDEIGPRGIGLVGDRPLRMRAEAGHLHIELDGPTHYAICERNGSRALGLGLGHLAQHLPTPGRATDPSGPRPPALRLADAPNLVPVWIRKPDGWQAELLLSEQQGRRGKVFCTVANFDPEQSELWRVDAAGNKLRQEQLTNEGDGFQIGFKPYEFICLRWK